MINRHALHALLNSSTARPSVKNWFDTFLTKWSKMSKVCLNLKLKMAELADFWTL